MVAYAHIVLAESKANGSEDIESVVDMHDNADWLHVEDFDAKRAGAPQNISVLHRIVRASKVPIQFFGGISLVHIAEMLLGLGVSRVALGREILKSERSPQHFYSRLGENAVGVAENREEAHLHISAGCPRILYLGQAKETFGFGIPTIVPEGCNGMALGEVSVEGILVPPRRLNAPRTL